MSELSKGELEKNEQQCLLDLIWNEKSPMVEQGGFNAQGIEIYRRNLLANAQRALMITFPTIFELLDSDVSESLVSQFLRISPPNQGDWTQWGEQFPYFLSTTEVGGNYPYLADCATLDWQVHCALHGSDQVIAQTSLQVLSDSEPEQIFIEFNHNVKILKTKYPLIDIFHAHHHEEEAKRTQALNNAKNALSKAPVEQVVMIYRPEFQPKVATLTASESSLMLCLLDGNSLGQSLDTIKDDSDFSFEQWLVNAIERNLIHNFKET
jgi:hypothetical protein